MKILNYLLLLPYIRVQLLFIIFPSIILWIFAGRYLIHYKKTFLIIAVMSFIWGLIFDLVASPFMGVWHFTSANTLNYWFLGLPLEEYMFLIIVPQEVTAFFILFRKLIYG